MRAGEVIALLDDHLIVSSADADGALLTLLDAMGAAAAELITLYYGQGIDSATREHVQAMLGQRYPRQTIELLDGGQPHYDYIISVE